MDEDLFRLSGRHRRDGLKARGNEREQERG
jgi:hypothetical protein